MFSNFGVSFKEPSTWQGIITLLTLVGISLDPVQKEVIGAKVETGVRV